MRDDNLKSAEEEGEIGIRNITRCMKSSAARIFHLVHTVLRTPCVEPQSSMVTTKIQPKECNPNAEGICFLGSDDDDHHDDDDYDYDDDDDDGGLSVIFYACNILFVDFFYSFNLTFLDKKERKVRKIILR